MNNFKSTIAGLTLALLTSTANAAPSDIMFILDGSGSMWGQIDGIAKIDTAKQTMIKLLDDVPAESRIGLMTYGTTDKKSCADVSYVNPLGSDRNTIKTTISEIQPLGKTPIERSLALGILELAQTQPSDVQKSLVLISDGIETCDGDPCQTASSATQNGVAMKVHVVGFDVDAEARQQLECIAKNGGGQYFNASNTSGFEKAMNAVVEIAQSSEPTPKPKSVAVKVEASFEDEFDGESLSDVWTMMNADEESYIVEEGELLMVSSKVQGFNTSDPSNLLQLNQKMPKGNWDMNLYMKYDAQTNADSFWFGLYKDTENYMSVHYWYEGGYCQRYVVSLNRMAKGESTHFPKHTAGSTTCGYGDGKMDEAKSSHAEEGIILTLSKRGRNYTASAKLGGMDINNESARTIETDTLTSLRVPGKLSMAIGKWKNANGEVLSLIDRVEIVPVK